MTEDSKNSVSGFHMTLFKQTKIPLTGSVENKALKQQWLITKACYVFRAMLTTSCIKHPLPFKYSKEHAKHVQTC